MARDKIKAAAREKKWREDNKERVAAYRKKWREDNKEKILAQQREWALKNKERNKELKAKWVADNKEKIREKAAQYRIDNREDINARARQHSTKPAYILSARAQAAKRRAAKLERTPQWANLDDIKAVYMQAEAMSLCYGEPYEVDHDIPLQGEFVSGLHVAANLRPIPTTENRSKSNKHFVDNHST